MNNDTEPCSVCGLKFTHQLGCSKSNLPTYSKKKEWIQIETPPGRPISRARVEPMPVGPYGLARQTEFIEGFTVEEAGKRLLSLTQGKPEVPWGYHLYTFVNGRAERVEYHYDTSD